MASKTSSPVVLWSFQPNVAGDASFHGISQLLCPCQVTANTCEVDCSHRALTRLPECVPDWTKILHFRFNKITYLSSGIFRRFPNLTYLDLSHNEIASLANDAFEGLANLERLFIDSNRLPLSPDTYSVDVFRPLERLKKLYLGNNTHDDVDASALDYPDQALARLTSLEQLGMDGLRNRSFGSGFSNMTSLRVLDVSGVNGTCRIEALLNDTFVHLGGLTHLSLEECRIRHIENNTFWALRNILELRLSGNYNLTLGGFANASISLLGTNLTRVFLNKIDNRCMGCKTLCMTDLVHLRSLPLAEIHLNDNNLQFFETHFTIILPRTLQRLYLRDNTFLVESDLGKLAYLPSLRLLDAGSRDPRMMSPYNDRYYMRTKGCSGFGSCRSLPKNLIDLQQEVHGADALSDGSVVGLATAFQGITSNVEWADLSWRRAFLNIKRLSSLPRE